MIRAFQAEFPAISLRQWCRLTGTGRTWFYLRPEETTRAEGEAEMLGAIEQVVEAFPGYGSRRVTEALKRQGWVVNRKRVQRLMRQHRLLCRLERRFIVTTDSGHARPTYPNLLPDHQITGCDQVWVADVTYIRLPGGFCYLACILDAWSRRCLGWHLATTLDATLPLQALTQALALRTPPPGWIHHSDRGVQYASTAYTDQLNTAGARISMSRVGTPYDNARIESFFKTLKREEVYLQHYQTVDEARQAIGQFIDEVYNTKRLHSQLGYRPPTEFEAVTEASVLP